ncbi:MAG TPA: MMPL family transporter, partial [Solirubrobacteraceae bacterium]|nr:MMPL family transporter [Solirubrobacteraceae bacterium]
IWAEARRRPLNEAIVAAGAGASRAISAAGIVLAVSFAATAVVPVQVFRELAFLVGVGLLIDAFLVRSLLVPAVIALVGYRSGWPGTTLRRVGPRAQRAVEPA